MTNVTESMDLSDAYNTFKALIFGILSVLVIGSDALCLVVLKRYYSHLKTPTRLFLTSLTCADLLSGLLYIFPLFVVYALGDVVTLDVMVYTCHGTRITIVLFGNVSLISLLCVNIDRYLAIEYPLKCETIVTTRRAWIAISCTWMLGLLTSLVTYFVLVKKADHMLGPELCHILYYAEIATLADIAMFTSLWIILPLTLIVIIYARIWVIANRHKKMEKNIGSLPKGAPHNRSANRKALNTFLLVTVISCCTYVPLSIATFYNNISNGSLSNSFLDLPLQSISLCTYWINIPIYTWRDQSFRNGAIQLFTR